MWISILGGGKSPKSDCQYLVVIHLWSQPFVGRGVQIEDASFPGRSSDAATWNSYTCKTSRDESQRLLKFASEIASQRWNRWWQLTYFLFSPRKLGKIPILTNIFQLGWNHQLVEFVSEGNWEVLHTWLKHMKNKFLSYPDTHTWFLKHGFCLPVLDICEDMFFFQHVFFSRSLVKNLKILRTFWVWTKWRYPFQAGCYCSYNVRKRSF